MNLSLHTAIIFFFFLIVRRPLTFTLFPYTTLFRSRLRRGLRPADGRVGPRRDPGLLGDDLLRPERSEEHTSELQSRFDLVCRLLLEKKKKPVHGCNARQMMRVTL